MLMWTIPLAVFVATFLAAWALAPYTMYRESDAERAQLQARIDERAHNVLLIHSLVTSKDRLTEVLEDGKRNEPRTGSPAEREENHARFMTAFRADICNALNGVNDSLRAAGFDPLEIHEITAAKEFKEICRLAELWRKALELAIEKLEV